MNFSNNLKVPDNFFPITKIFSYLERRRNLKIKISKQQKIFSQFWPINTLIQRTISKFIQSKCHLQLKKTNKRVLIEDIKAVVFDECVFQYRDMSKTLSCSFELIR